MLCCESYGASMAMMTGGQAVAETLALLGVSKVFGIVSVHNLPIYDAISLHPDIQVINVRHEQAAAHAADAYSRVTGELGVILTSTGPGALNAVAGIYEAAFVSSKLLMVPFFFWLEYMSFHFLNDKIWKSPFPQAGHLR